MSRRGRPKAPMKYVNLKIPLWAFEDFYKWLKGRKYDIEIDFEDLGMLKGVLFLLGKTLTKWRRSANA